MRVYSTANTVRMQARFAIIRDAILVAEKNRISHIVVMSASSTARSIARPRAAAPTRRRDATRRTPVAAPRASSSSSSSAVESPTRVDSYYDWAEFPGRIHYERSGDPATCVRHVLLLHGFGVGTFHYDAQLEALADDDTCVWAIDYCGQGSSWPHGTRTTNAGATAGFQYSADTWRDQIEHFVDTVIGAPTYVAGNSLGGYLAVYLAATRPDLVRGLFLLNATPFWAFNPNDENDGSLLGKLAPWRGALPAPGWIRAPLKAYWDSFRSVENVRGLLGLVYRKKETLDDTLVRNIITPTDNDNALDAFCSVVWSPKAKLGFDDMLDEVNTRVTDGTMCVAMLYGRDDPWVVPLWGQRLKRAVPSADYYELAETGHCPAHESPATVNDLMGRYMRWHGGKGEKPEGSADGFGSLIDGKARNPFEKLEEWRYERDRAQ